MSPQSSLGHLPDGAWTFDAEVTACFQDMLARSIPQLDVMRQLVFAIGCLFVHPGDHVLDLGCSLGDALAPFVTKYGASCTYTGVDVSAPMREAALARFQDVTSADAYGLEAPVHIEILDCDLRTTLPPGMSALTLSILTLMFIPVEYRAQLLARVYAQTQVGGALIVVEKVLGQSGDVAHLFIEAYHALKRQQGYTREEIVRKALSLEGVLVPLTAAWNEQALRQAGFREVECFWRWCNFAGFLAIK
jgi:tRNA (cmo5U34)-methyltransferase